MLKVVSCTSYSDANVKFDEYIPITFKCLSENTPVPLYWRFGDFERSLMEIGIHPNTGALTKIVLTKFNNIFRSDGGEEFLTIPGTEGVPVFDISSWPDDRFKDEMGVLDVYVGDSFFYIKFLESFITCKVLSVNNVSFGLDGSSNLLWIAFDDLRQEDIDIAFL